MPDDVWQLEALHQHVRHRGRTLALWPLDDGSWMALLDGLLVGEGSTPDEACRELWRTVERVREEGR